MKLKRGLIVTLMLASMNTALAQCGYAEPCGGVPWRIEPLVALYSPTPIPTFIATAVPTAIPTDANPSLGATPTEMLDIDELAGHLSTLESIAQATPFGISVFETPVTSELAANAGDFFSYAAGLKDINLGFASPLVAFLFAWIGLTLVITTATVTLPLISAIWGIIRKVVTLILDFLPL